MVRHLPLRRGELIIGGVDAVKDIQIGFVHIGTSFREWRVEIEEWRSSYLHSQLSNLQSVTVYSPRISVII
jgi:hypothetical protein